MSLHSSSPCRQGDRFPSPPPAAQPSPDPATQGPTQHVRRPRCSPQRFVHCISKASSAAGPHAAATGPEWPLAGPRPPARLAVLHVVREAVSFGDSLTRPLPFRGLSLAVSPKSAGGIVGPPGLTPRASDSREAPPLLPRTLTPWARSSRARSFGSALCAPFLRSTGVSMSLGLIFKTLVSFRIPVRNHLREEAVSVRSCLGASGGALGCLAAHHGRVHDPDSVCTGPRGPGGPGPPSTVPGTQ